jgi:hypothetical protein
MPQKILVFRFFTKRYVYIILFYIKLFSSINAVKLVPVSYGSGSLILLYTELTRLMITLLHTEIVSW